MTTKKVSNQDFIRSVFSGAGPDSFAWLCSFQGDPKTASNRDWAGRSCRADSPASLDETGNTYFNISTLKVHDGRVTRQGENFDALHVVVLDDIGSKATLPEGFSPSYLIETSNNNFQAGLLLSAPCHDLATIKALFKVLAAKGFTDSGAQGPQSRYVRLPVGFNHKGECGPGGFPHHLTHWNPDRRFTVDEIVSTFGLDLAESASAKEVGAKRVVPHGAAATATDKADEIIIAKVLRSAKARRVWNCDGGDGFASGSDADQFLLNSITFSTESPEQVERIYSQSPRASRKSSDGTCKWLKRADYRKRSIESAFRFVEAHPHGDADDARVTVEAAVDAAKVSGDFRGIYAPEVVDAFAVLEKGDAANYDYLRQQARKAGATLATLDAEVGRASDAQNLNHDDAAELAIASLGGMGGILFNRGVWWNWRQELGIWKRIDSDETIKQAILAVLPKKQINAGAIGSVLSVLRTKVAREDVVFDRLVDENVVNCLNGTLHLRSGRTPFDGRGATEDWWELRPHRREDLLTVRVPVAWEPSAQCPRFERFLDDITHGDADAQEKRQVLIEAIGYSLMPTTREERFVILHGESSSNGKSTLLEIIRRLGGAENASALTLQQLGERFGLAGLQSKLVNLCAEIPRGAALPDDAIKKLTSGDTITVERKGRDHYEMKPYATLWFATNTLPNLRDLSPATLEKRCILVELNRSFQGESRDARLIDKLTEELPGILYLCVETFGAMFALSREASSWTTATRGGPLEAIQWFGGLLEDPPSSVRAKAAWRQTSDPVRQFAADTLMTGSEHYVAASELFGAWQTWAEANGVRLSLTSHHLTARLKSMFPQIVTGDAARSGRKRGIRGLGLVGA